MLPIVLAALIEDKALEESFEEFVHCNEKMIFNIAFQIVNNYHDAEEATIMTLTSIANHYSYVSALSDEARISYSVRSVRNHAINIYNENKRRRRRELPIDEFSNVGAYDKQIDDMLDRVTADKVVQCMHKLDEKYNDIMYLHYVNGMTSSQIAKTLNMNKKTVETRLMRGRQKLLDLLEVSIHEKH